MSGFKHDLVDPAAFHTALRKGCDTEWASTLHLLIKCTPNAQWILFCKFLSIRMMQGTSFTDAITDIVDDESCDLTLDVYVRESVVVSHSDVWMLRNSPEFLVLQDMFNRCRLSYDGTFRAVGKCLEDWFGDFK